MQADGTETTAHQGQSTGQDAGATRPPSVDDLLLHVTLSSLAAGRRGLVLAATRCDAEEDTSITSIWHCEPGGQPREIDRDAHGPAWCGDAIACLRSTDDGKQVFLHALDSDGKPRQVSHVDAEISSIEDADAERQRMLLLVVRRTDGGDDAPVAVEFLPYKTDGTGLTCREKVELGVLDLRSGGYSTLVEGDHGDIVEAKWNAAGDAIAFIRRRTGLQRHRMDLWLRGGGDLRQLTEGLASISALAWSPDGSQLAVAATDIEGDSVIRVHLVDVDTGCARDLGVEVGTPATLEWTSDGQAVRTVQAERGLQRVVEVDAGGAVRVLWEDPQRHAFDMAAIDDTIGFVAAGPAEGPELWITDGACARARPVSSFNAWRRERPRVEAVKRGFDVPDGQGGTERVDGWLLTPAGEGPFPLLLDMHGGPHTLVTFEYERYVHWPVLLDQGWAILALNAAGSSSYGQAFAHRIRGRWGELDWPQWRAAVDRLREEGVAGDRVAVFGHSYGGFLAAWALTRDEALDRGVVSGAIVNHESHTGTSDTGYYVGPYAMRGELSSERNRYHALSPLQGAHRVLAPVLLLQGRDDQRCPVGQAEEFFAALVRGGRARVRMVQFPGGSHHVSTTGRPSHRKAYFEELLRWLLQATP